MRIVVAVIIYDRFYNLIEFVRCWNLCETSGAQLVVIHNYANEADRDSYAAFCLEAGIHYIARENVGFDIAALQDVCRKRLPDFPEYDYLLWCCDDLHIMRKDFIQQYVNKMADAKIGCVAMEISRSVRLHIRTTGFMIKREVAERLQFPADPVTTKEECYKFEHRSKTGGTMLEQIARMRIATVKVQPDINKSPFWDSGFKQIRNRSEEHYKHFPKEEKSSKKIAFICPIYNSHPVIVASLIAQTHPDWHLFLLHDGPSDMDIRGIVEAMKDPRITYIETETRQGNWGHGYRQEYLEKLKDSDFDFITITNGDNYHMPTYCEYMLKGFTNGQVASYCSHMVHSYTAWKIIDCKLQQGYVDCAGVMVRKDVACEIGWRDINSHSSDWVYFEDIIKKYGVAKFAKVTGCLLSHN